VVRDRDECRGYVYAGMNLRVPLNAIDFLTRYGAVSFSGRSILCGVGLPLSVSRKSFRRGAIYLVRSRQIQMDG
jgi:hypothetical protein